MQIGVKGELYPYAHACTIILWSEPGVQPCELFLQACCVIVSIYIPVGYLLVDS